MNKKKIAFMVTLLLGSLLVISGIAATNFEPQEQKLDQAVPKPVSGCPSTPPYYNTTGVPQNLTVVVTDNCPSLNSLIYANGSLLGSIPYGTTQTFNVTLQPGKRINLNCRGTGNGWCSFIVQ